MDKVKQEDLTNSKEGNNGLEATLLSFGLQEGLKTQLYTAQPQLLNEAEEDMTPWRILQI